MPSPFEAFDARMQAGIDRLFGGGIRVVPMVADTNYTGGPDPARPVREGVRATMAKAPGAGPTDYSNSQRNGAAVASMPAEVWIDAAAYAAIGYEIRRGDRIVEGGNISFTVAAVHIGDAGDARIILG